MIVYKHNAVISLFNTTSTTLSCKKQLYCIVYIADVAKYTGLQQFYNFPQVMYAVLVAFLVIRSVFIVTW